MEVNPKHYHHKENFFSPFSLITMGENVKKYCNHFTIYVNEVIMLCTEKAMATHSSTLAWKIPWMEEPGRLPSMRLQRVGHD